MFVLSSPSGAGKTTMSRALMAEDSGITMSVSATTRSPRPGEVDGVDYYFVSHDQFQSMVEENALLEWATVFGNRYGTPRAPVESALADGRDVLFDIDWQGTQQLQQTDAASDLVRVFILPPHLDELERRLKNRNTDHPEVIADRMARARDEISHWGEYDYILVNDDAETCLNEIRAILKAERLRRKRQLGLAGFVRGMLGE
ncbi:MAG: guanylate kinase [Sphingomonadales bacterium 32-65-25]|jgi:guanylate kinase|uniref:guanylate kinase n=1 Tax=Sandarakinorhabdus limnophila TaxID=210512 RepID=UPI000BCEC067|nr:guanylate kinase [Sandarakinorhabdus limnophila]MCM0032866.1 guanylate kinase [Sandarakinorhabdus limnophila]OYW14727.1 MAG: guanylate kinase [Sphingomonadales bacterium 12-62-5]OYX77767.1 MAG: guanylate kinase [Sphingomonadales bacterium 32-65-25]OYZ14907.1 MAG: guanylate kinase [Sphingomonadales bacterium 28-64-96]